MSPFPAVFGVTHPGKTRGVNEDAMIWSAELSFVGVADGMGGHNAGEVASRLALDSILGFLQKSADDDDFTWPYGVSPQLSLTANRLATALKIANRRVFRAAEDRAEYAEMGTTVVAVIIEEGTVTFGNVGDSRIYSFDHGKLQQLTRDDSWAVLLSQQTDVDPSAFKNHPMRNVLTNAVGAQAELKLTLGEQALGSGTLILCTDGLHGALSDEAMASILGAEQDLQRAAETLVQTALERDGRDNITVVLARSS